MNPEVQHQIIAFIVMAIPLIATLWKVFTTLQGIEDRLEKQVRDVDLRLSELSHQSQLRSAQMEALNDKLVLAINGTKELVGHIRTRTQAQSAKIEERLNQLEKYLIKTTDYQSRE